MTRKLSILLKDYGIRNFMIAVFFIFVLTAVLLLFELDSKTFNFIEGIYWLTLGVFVLTLLKATPHKYKRLALFTSLILILFSITDFIEIGTGAYWIPWWLLVWNIICVSGLILSLAWYIKLRYSY
ncbi:hypothetical protein BMS3Abin15_00372 [bacterium BMS3Abin15]|nr:hypothetical protein BMS3Abin15_00372 [bacterium BMS3Abin15]HDH07701.1 hypothetical protein [Candidatus Moranbacteria bacterium]HDZ85347.1 hypothetical protein [Candidatus Moranbacteria bacterium]